MGAEQNDINVVYEAALSKMRHLNHNPQHHVTARWWQNENGLDTVFLTCPDCLGILTPQKVSRDGATEFIYCIHCTFSDYITLNDWTGREYPERKKA